MRTEDIVAGGQMTNTVPALHPGLPPLPDRGWVFLFMLVMAAMSAIVFPD
jgi:hypothetical protein